MRIDWEGPASASRVARSGQLLHRIKTNPFPGAFPEQGSNRVTDRQAVCYPAKRRGSSAVLTNGVGKIARRWRRVQVPRTRSRQERWQRSPDGNTGPTPASTRANGDGRRHGVLSHWPAHCQDGDGDGRSRVSISLGLNTKPSRTISAGRVTGSSRWVLKRHQIPARRRRHLAGVASPYGAKFAGAENGPRQLADQKTVPLRDRPARCRRAPPGLVQPAWRCMFDHADLLRRVARPATAQSRTDLGCCSSLFARGQDTAPAVFPAKSPMIITASKRALTAAGSNTSADRPTGSSPRAP